MVALALDVGSVGWYDCVMADDELGNRFKRRAFWAVGGAWATWVSLGNLKSGYDGLKWVTGGDGPPRPKCPPPMPPQPQVIYAGAAAFGVALCSARAVAVISSSGPVGPVLVPEGEAPMCGVPT